MQSQQNWNRLETDGHPTDPLMSECLIYQLKEGDTMVSPLLAKYLPMTCSLLEGFHAFRSSVGWAGRSRPLSD